MLPCASGIDEDGDGSLILQRREHLGLIVTLDVRKVSKGGRLVRRRRLVASIILGCVWVVGLEGDATVAYDPVESRIGPAAAAAVVLTAGVARDEHLLRERQERAIGQEVGALHGASCGERPA